MSKRIHKSESAGSPRSTLAMMVVGALLVVGLVAWALSRSVAPRSAEIPQDTAAAPAVAQTPPVASEPPMGATAAPIPTNTAAPQQGDEIASFPRISVDEAKQLFDSGNVTVVDVRDFASYAAGHIPGAVHIPMAQVQGEMANLPKGKPIVTYCT